MRRRLAAACLSALLLTATAACGSDSADSSGASGGSSSEGASSGTSSSGSIDGLTVTGDFGKEPTVKVDGMNVDKAESEVLVQGDGEKLGNGSAALYRFVIANGGTGENVASNYNDNDPQRMVVSEQPPAIKDAVDGQRIGSRVAVAMPVKDLLGDQGAPQVGLNADDDVVIVFDLLKAAEAPLDAPQGTTVKPPANAPTVVDQDGQVTAIDFSSAPKSPPKKLQVIPLIQGKGTAIKEGDSVTVDYFGTVWGKGDQPFDQSYDSAPATFTLAKGSLIDGWVQGLKGVKAGSRVMLVVPPSLGYGAQGSGDQIPGNSTLVFVVDVLGVNL
jgi:peptidylprolyl isomerase